MATYKAFTGSFGSKAMSREDVQQGSQQGLMLKLSFRAYFRASIQTRAMKESRCVARQLVQFSFR